MTMKISLNILIWSKYLRNWNNRHHLLSALFYIQCTSSSGKVAKNFFTTIWYLKLKDGRYLQLQIREKTHVREDKYDWRNTTVEVILMVRILILSLSVAKQTSYTYIKIVSLFSVLPYMLPQDRYTCYKRNISSFKTKLS